MDLNIHEVNSEVMMLPKAEIWEAERPEKRPKRD
jgi:hypothetical protein